jgi:hypothetical protein
MKRARTTPPTAQHGGEGGGRGLSLQPKDSFSNIDEQHNLILLLYEIERIQATRLKYTDNNTINTICQYDNIIVFTNKLN